MKDESASLPEYLVDLINQMRSKIHDPNFRSCFRRKSTDFTRQRCLTFPTVVLLVLQRTSKSIQRHLNEFLAKLGPEGSGRVSTPSAWTQARAKLRAEAFVELNKSCVLPSLYGPSA